MKPPVLFLAVSLLSNASPVFAASQQPFAPKPAMPTSDTDTATWQKSEHDELEGDILPFWIKNAVDHDRGGFYGWITNDLHVKKDAVRGSLLSARILWAFSAAYREDHKPETLAVAKWAYDDLNHNFWDKENGGFYWTRKANGEPEDTSKQTYGEGFCVYAMAEYYLATKEQPALDRAIETFRLIEKHAKDPRFGGYWEQFSKDWTRDTKQRRGEGSGAGAAPGKSQNTHLHVLEAYTNLLRAWPNDEIRNAHKALIEIMLDKVLDNKTHHLILFLKDDYTPTSHNISFGHDIEFSWLLTEAGDVLGDAALKERIHNVALEVADACYREGMAPDGHIYYETDRKTNKISKEPTQWWADAEAMVGYYNAYQLSGDEKYRAASFKMWNYIEDNLVDHTYGEWYWAVDPQGIAPETPKVDMWKCPYHNGRSCLEMERRLGESK
ncbi:MAG TPA: AGE family epimerase/isomerase [Opitutaceae bacterium]